MTTSTDSQVIEIAMRAWQALADGHHDGNFQAYLNMVTDDYEFYMPVGEFRGRNVGRERAAECYAAIVATQPKFTFSEPLRVSSQGNTVVIEFEDKGTLSGIPYHNRIASSFDVRDDSICGYREYFGEVDPTLITAMSATMGGT